MDLMDAKRDPSKVDPQSTIFRSFRTLGLVTNSVPSALQKRGSNFYLVTSIGRSFQIYDCTHISLVFVGPDLEEEIISLVCVSDFTICGLLSSLVVCNRAKFVCKIEFPLTFGELLLLQVIDDQSVFALSVHGVLLRVNFVTGLCESEMPINLSCVSMIQLPTYRNKQLISLARGGLQLWNVEAKKCIYSFESCNRKSIPIIVLCAAPAIDIVAIGYSDGLISLMNAKSDTVLFSLSIGDGRRVTALAFREFTDDDNDLHLFASADDSGTILIWDLKERRIYSTIAKAHSSSIHTLRFLGSVLLSVASDNSIKQWTILENGPVGTCSLLKQRTGHREPVTFVSFYGETSDGDGFTSLLSGCRDGTLRFSCIERDEKNCELSQHRQGLAANAPPLGSVLQIASCSLRSKQWCDVISSHERDNQVVLWQLDARSVGELRCRSTDKQPVKAATITGCGNFIILGSAGGTVDVFNIQSGQHRRTWVASSRPVVGIAVDARNEVCSIASMDNSITFWNLSSGKKRSSIQVSSSPIATCYRRTCDLFAVAFDDFSIALIDMETERVIRIFEKDTHINRITGLAISSDARMLVSASFDKTIRVWDVVSGCLLSSSECHQIPTSIALSPNDEYLVSSHANEIGVKLWTNSLFYSTTQFDRLAQHLDSLSGLGGSSEPEAAVDEMAAYHLATQTRNRWAVLFNLAAIKNRNRAEQSSEAQAPLSFPATDEGKGKGKNQIALEKTKFPSALLASDWDALREICLQASASAIDFEIRTLSPESEFLLLRQFLKFCWHQLKSRTDVDLIQAYLHVAFNEYSSVLKSSNPMFANILEPLESELNILWDLVSHDLIISQGLLDFHLNKN